MVLWKLTRNISLALPEELLARVDEAAKSFYMSRSEYIRFVLQKATIGQQPKTTKKNGATNPLFFDLDDS
ncbi:MAG TPA: ribbon-helix-helix domain-containing protein [Candidatus Saccharimonadales bacterium]